MLLFLMMRHSPFHDTHGQQALPSAAAARLLSAMHAKQLQSFPLPLFQEARARQHIRHAY